MVVPLSLGMVGRDGKNDLNRRDCDYQMISFRLHSAKDGKNDLNRRDCDYPLSYWIWVRCYQMEKTT